MLKPDLSTFVPDESCSLPAEQGLLTGAVLTCPPCLLLKVSLSFKGYFPLHMQRSIMDLALSLGGIVSFLSCLDVADVAVLDAFGGVRVTAAIGVHGPNSANLTCCIIINQSEVNFTFHF